MGLRVRSFVLASIAAGSLACSLLVDTGGLSGGGGGEGTGEGGVPEASGEGGVPPGTPPGTPPTPPGVPPAGDGGSDADAAPLDYKGNVLLDGPVAYYRLQDTSGTVVHDEMGAHDGTYKGPYQLGQAGLATGMTSVRFSNYARFDADSVAKLPAGTFASYTIEAFVSSEVPAGVSGFVWTFENAAGTGGPGLWIDDATRAVRVNAKGAVYSSTKVFADTTWHHVVMTYESGLGTVYIDGAQDGTWAVTTPGPDRTTFIVGVTEVAGDGGPGLNDPFTGRIAEVAIYAKALSAARVAAHYAARP